MVGAGQRDQLAVRRECHGRHRGRSVNHSQKSAVQALPKPRRRVRAADQFIVRREYQLADRTRMVGDREQQLIKRVQAIAGCRSCRTLAPYLDRELGRPTSGGEHLAVRRKRERKHRSAMPEQCVH